MFDKKKYYQENKEKILEYGRKYSKIYNKENKEKEQKRKSEWYQKNRKKEMAIC